MNDLGVTILMAILTAFATATLTFFGYWRRAKAELQKEFESRFNERKWEVYGKFVRWYGEIINADRLPSSKEYLEFASDLLLVGSDEVVKAHNDLLRRIGEVVRKGDFTDGVPETDRAIWGNVAIEMRKDLGYKSTISTEDLWILLNVRDVMIGEWGNRVVGNG